MFDLFDAHCDTFVKARDENKDIYDNDMHISIKKFQNFKSAVQFFAVCYADGRAEENAYKWYRDSVDFYYDSIQKYAKYISPVKSFSDIEENREESKISAILAIEGGEVLNGSMEKLLEAYDFGVRSMNLTWNNSNELGYSNKDNMAAGLTETGKDFVKKMNELGMMIDVSHLSDAGFWDVYKLSSKPFIASHSNSRELCGHKRNLTDDQMKALKEVGGVTGLNLAASFLEKDGKPQMDDCIKHLERMLKYAGEDGVGLGCDFDGIGTPEFELSDVSKMNLLHERCMKEFGEALTEKLFYNNFLNVTKKVIK